MVPVLMLDEFYFADPRLILVPIEHLSPEGVSGGFAAMLAQRSERSEAIRELIDGALPRYWSRASRLASASRTWDHPRIRNIAIVDSATRIPPYAQLLNTTTWTLFDSDFDPETSSVELVAYLLAHGDRMSRTGEATMAALHNAAYWFDLSNEELADFQVGARASTRPDAEAFAALADAVDWMRELGHETLRPPPSISGYLQIAKTGLLVPRSLEKKPAELVHRWTDIAKSAVTDYYAAYAPRDSSGTSEILDWLRQRAPQLLITGQKNRVLWEADHPDRIGAVRSELRHAGSAALKSIKQDLEVIDHHTRDFEARAVGFPELPEPDPEIGQDGYAYLFRGRKMLAYNLHEPNLDRLRAPALPFARAMLGARAYHEWCHLAVDAGWVRLAISDEELEERIIAARDAFDDTLAEAPETVRRAAGGELLALTQAHPPDEVLNWGGGEISVPGAAGGSALLRMLLPRVADFKTNLLASRFQSVDEREAYVRQNIRNLRAEYAHPQIWQMFSRYMYEFQYLQFSAVDDRRSYFLQSTGFEAEFLSNGTVSPGAFDRIDQALRQLLGAFQIDASKVDL